jgi:hypothetical protein
LRSYGKGIADQVRAAGGQVYAVSSEPQTLADRAVAEWKLDFESIGDPHHEIAETCRERGWLDLFVNPRLGFLRQSVGNAISDFEPTHPKGYFQPGVIALTREGRVLYRWRGVPTHQNMGGATERPTAEHVWNNVTRALEEGADAGDAVLDAAPPLDQRGLPWLVFASLLIANGWFRRVQGFTGLPMIGMAAVRLVAFIAAWIAAFVFLPVLPVAIALAAWAIFISREVRWVGQEFQDVSSAQHPAPATET